MIILRNASLEPTCTCILSHKHNLIFILASYLQYQVYRSRSRVYHRGGRSKGAFAHANYCNFVNFNFSTRFFAQIVENRETQLSSLFLGPGDNFSKSYDENQIWSKCGHARAGLMRRSQVPYNCHTNRFSS